MDNFAPLKLPGEGKRVSVLGVPLSFGQSMAGVDLGPSAMRVADLTRRIKKLGYEVKDLDDLKIEETQSTPAPTEKLKYLPEIHEVCERLAIEIEKIVDAGELPITIGGDHSIAIGSLVISSSAPAVRNARAMFATLATGESMSVVFK